MMQVRIAVLLAPALVWIALAGGPPPSSVVTVRLNGHTFSLPAGFTIELAAGPPLVERPIAIDFDEQGRLYITESSGSNEKVEVQLQKKPHRVLRLDSTKADGKFDQGTVFAPNMMFPEGVMYHQGSIYVAAPPSIWKLTDTDGDGVADQRVEWFQGKTLTGCANDLHGPYLGPDGWIYWGKGAFAKQTYDIPGKAPFVTRAAHIFRARPNGSGVEPVMTGGMDNPVDVVFTPGGERIFTTTFLQYPGGGKRDGLIHAIYGGIYGKAYHDVIDAHPWTGPSVMPVLTHLGAAAPSGLHRYESNSFGPAYTNNLFCCCFNMRKVTRHVLAPDGATFKTMDSDFLVSDNPDFHPTDVIEDADGSLLVVDTGGWYKLCCPTTQLIKPEALGAIYRIRKLNAPKIDDPRGPKIEWAKLKGGELPDMLADSRPFVRKKAAEEWVSQQEKSTNRSINWSRGLSPEARLQLVWAFARMEGEFGAFIVQTYYLDDNDETVRQAAINAVGLRRDRIALPQLLKLLKGDSRQNRRAAAEALGRIGDKSAVPALLDALAEPCDRVLEHSLIYALIEIGDTAGTAAGLKNANTSVRRAALIALDQMAKSALKVEMVGPNLASVDPRMKEAAWWIAGRHADWGGTVAGLLQERLSAKNLVAADKEELVRQLGKFAKSGPVQKLLADSLTAPGATPEARLVALKAMARSGLKVAPESWIAGIVQMLVSGNVESKQEAITTARVWRDAKSKSNTLANALRALGNDATAPASLRLSALAAVPGGLSKVEGPQLDLLLAHLGSDQPLVLRTAAADVLARAKLTNQQLRMLISTLKLVGPMELDRVLAPFTGSSDDAVGKELIVALHTAPAKSSIRPDTLKPRLAKFGPTVQKLAEELFAGLNLDVAKQNAHLDNLLQTLPAGDRNRGQLVFNSQKAACFSCHAIGYLGGTVGPDLTHIARTRTERDFLEAVVFPNATFPRGYESIQVTTKAGKVINGVLRNDGPNEIVLATANEETRIAREEIDDMQPSPVSVMQSGYEQLLTPVELADLLAFLKACK